MNFCIPKQQADKFLKDIADEKLDPKKLAKLSSYGRTKELSKYFDKETVKKANLHFEQKLLNKYQDPAMIKWVHDLTGVTTELKQELVDKIKARQMSKMKRVFSPEEDEMFLKELVEHRMGIGIEKNEAKLLFKLAKKFEDSKSFFNKRTVLDALKDLRGLTEREETLVGGIMDKLNTEKGRKKLNTTVIRKLKKILEGEDPDEATKLYVKNITERMSKGQVVGDNKLFAQSKIALENYMDDMVEGKEVPFKEYWARVKALPKNFEKKDLINVSKWAKITGTGIKNTASLLKALKATWDISFIGRQGLKALLTWEFKTFRRGAEQNVKSFGKTIAKHIVNWDRALKGFRALSKEAKRDIMDKVKMDIYAHENASAGFYEKMKIDIGNIEEAIPTTAHEKVPILGVLFQASDNAYLSTAYKMRADLANTFIEKARKNGVELTDETLRGYGKLINSMTGRGEVGLGKLGEKTNIAFFSPKFAQSQLDFLTAHSFDKKIPEVVKREAQKNLGKALVSVAVMSGIIYGIGKVFGVDVELQADPRSSDFGKAKVGNARFDLTGGMGGYITLASRLGAGLLGKDSYKSSTGVTSNFTDYGKSGPTAMIGEFAGNKLSPLLSTIFDMVEGEDFGHNPVGLKALKEDTWKTTKTMAKNIGLPISVENFMDIKGLPKTDKPLGWVAAGLDLLGISANVYEGLDWNNTVEDTKIKRQFKEKVGADKFNEANKKYYERLREKRAGMVKSKEYKNLSNEDKKKDVSALSRLIMKEIYKEYGFKYKMDKKTDFQKAQDKKRVQNY